MAVKTKAHGGQQKDPWPSPSYLQVVLQHLAAVQQGCAGLAQVAQVDLQQIGVRMCLI